jgi:hypothetical protein
VTQDLHNSLGALKYYLQFSVMYKDVEMPVSCISGLMWKVLMEFGNLSKINIQNNNYLQVIEQNTIQGLNVCFL